MQTKKRTAESGVVRHLLAEPYRYQFMQAVRILLCWLRSQHVSQAQAFSQVLRFKNSMSLSFPASEIEHLSLDDNEQLILIPTFMRFLGVGGTLPLHHSERIAAYRMSSKDAGVSAFLDIFSHRMVVLYYQAWEKYRLESTLQTQANDAQLPLLLALAGVRRTALPSSAEPGSRDTGRRGLVRGSAALPPRLRASDWPRTGRVLRRASRPATICRWLGLSGKKSAQPAEQCQLYPGARRNRWPAALAPGHARMPAYRPAGSRRPATFPAAQRRCGGTGKDARAVRRTRLAV